MRRDHRHHILSLTGLPHTRGASISELTACTSPNAGHAYSFSDVMGHSQVGVVERSGGYGVLNNEAHMIRTTRQRTLKAGTWDLVCCPPSSLRSVFRDYPSTGRQDRWRISDPSVLPFSGPDRGSGLRATSPLYLVSRNPLTL